MRRAWTTAAAMVMVAGGVARADIHRWAFQIKTSAVRPTEVSPAPSYGYAFGFGSQFTLVDYDWQSDTLCVFGRADADGGTPPKSADGFLMTTCGVNVSAETSAYAGGASVEDASPARNPCDYLESVTFASSQLQFVFGSCGDPSDAGGRRQVLASAAGAATILEWTSGSAAGWKFCTTVDFNPSVDCANGVGDPPSLAGLKKVKTFIRLFSGSSVVGTSGATVVGSAADGGGLLLGDFTGSGPYQATFSVTAPSGVDKVELVMLAGDQGAFDLDGDGDFDQDDVTFAGALDPNDPGDQELIRRVDFTDGSGGDPNGEVDAEDIDTLQMFLDGGWGFIPFDTNGDGQVDCDDLPSGLNTALTSSPTFPIALGSAGYEVAIDLDYDGEVSAAEAARFLTRVNPSDFNQDGFTDYFDYDDFVDCFENAVCPGGRDADINLNGFVDYTDYDDFVAAFEGTHCY